MQVMRLYMKAKGNKQPQSSMSLFQQLIKTEASPNLQSIPKQRKTAATHVVQGSARSSAGPAQGGKAKTAATNQAAPDGHVTVTCDQQVADWNPVQQAHSNQLGLPNRHEATAADSICPNAQSRLSVTENQHTAAPDNEPLSSEAIWESLLRNVVDPAESSPPGPPTPDPLPASGAPLVVPFSMSAMLSVSATPAEAAATDPPAVGMSAVVSASASSAKPPAGAAATLCSGASAPEHTSATASASAEMPASLGAMFSAMTPSSQPLPVSSTPAADPSAGMRHTTRPLQSADLAKTVQATLQMSNLTPISLNDLSQRINDQSQTYDVDLCMCWRVLMKHEKLQWRVMLNSKSSSRHCRLSELSQPRQQLAHKLHPSSPAYDASVSASWKGLDYSAGSAFRDSLLLSADSSGKEIWLPSALPHPSPASALNRPTPLFREAEFQASDFPALPSLPLGAAHLPKAGKALTPDPRSQASLPEHARDLTNSSNGAASTATLPVGNWVGTAGNNIAMPAPLLAMQQAPDASQDATTAVISLFDLLKYACCSIFCLVDPWNTDLCLDTCVLLLQAWIPSAVVLRRDVYVQC